MDAKLVQTVYRLIDLLEACESHAKTSDLSLEALLCMNQARIAVGNLEYAHGVKLKEFLLQTLDKSIAHRDKMQ